MLRIALSIFRTLWLVPLGALGVMLLALTAAHQIHWGPYESRPELVHIVRASHEPDPNEVPALAIDWQPITVSAWGESRTIPLGPLALAAAAVTLVTLLLYPRALKAAALAVLRPINLLLLLSAVAVFLWTLRPTEREWHSVLYVTLAGAGTLALVTALAPVAAYLPRRLARLARTVRYGFYACPTWLFLLLEFAAVFATTNLISWTVFYHAPHIADSAAQLFHGKILLTGRTWIPMPGAFFHGGNMVINDPAGRWYSQYPPGHAALLALGHLLGRPWLVNPLCGALAVVLLYPLGKLAYGPRVGRLATLLGTCSPFLLFMSSEFMNHASTMLLAEVFVLGALGLMDRARWYHGVLIGAGLGGALLIRPYTALALAVPLTAYACVHYLGLVPLAAYRFFRPAPYPLGSTWGRTLAHFTAAGLIAGLLVAGALYGFARFNESTTGDPYTSGYTARAGAAHAPGFGMRRRGLHTVEKGLYNTHDRLAALNKYLFEIPFPSLAFVCLALAAPVMRTRLAWKHKRADVLLLLTAGSLAAAYAAYWYEGLCFGPRFLFEAFPCYVVLAARGLIAAPLIARRVFHAAALAPARRLLAMVLLVAFPLGLATNFPFLCTLYGDNYHYFDPAILREVHAQNLHHAVVFVSPAWPDFANLLAFNEPDLDTTDVVFALDQGRYADRQFIEARFPDRKAYTADRAPRSMTVKLVPLKMRNR